jgi:hypothetical protein
VEVLPPALRDWAEAEAAFHQVPVTMSAVFALQASMTAAIHLSVKIRDGWEEPCVWQSLLVASPSERKSPVFSAAFKPVYAWQAEQKQKHEKMRLDVEREIASLLSTETGEAEPAKSGTPVAAKVAELKQRLEAMSGPKRRLAEDVTPEEFMRLMSENDDTQCLVSDEGDVFQSFGGRYAKGEAKLAPLLKGWDARTPLMYDRVGGGGNGKQRTNILINKPRAGISIAGQHGVLTALRSLPVFRQKGMLARLCFVVLGERKEERELCPPGVERAVRDAYGYAISKLFQIDAEAPLLLANRIDLPNGWKVPVWLHELRGRVERGLLYGGEFEEIPDWAGKIVSNMARIAAVIEAMGGGGEANLMLLAEFFCSHAKRALCQSDTSAPDRAPPSDVLEELLEAISDKWGGHLYGTGKVKRSDPFTLRQVMRVYRRITRSMVLVPLLEELTARGHLDEVPQPDGFSIGNKNIGRRFVLVVDSSVKRAPKAAPESIPKLQPKRSAAPTAAPTVYDDWFDDRLDPEDET